MEEGVVIVHAVEDGRMKMRAELHPGATTVGRLPGSAPGYTYLPDGCELKDHCDRHRGDVTALDRRDDHWYVVYHDD